MIDREIRNDYCSSAAPIEKPNHVRKASEDNEVAPSI